MAWLLLALLLCAGILYQSISTKLDEQKYPPPGTLVDVGGYRLHLHSIGTGGPTIVLDSGLSGISSDWWLVAPEIAKFSRVVTYDRAGTGWSDASPQSRTGAHIVQELHRLLHVAKIPGPYVVVGHSNGGAYAQLFAATFPEEVIGVVLVDAWHETPEKRVPQRPIKTPITLLHKPIFMRLATILGITRFFLVDMYMKAMMPYLPQSMWDARRALAATTKNCCTVSEEASAFSLSLKQLAEVDRSTFANKPCIIITAGAPDLSVSSASGVQKVYLREFHAVWNDLQKELVGKFPVGRQMIAEKSDHMIPWRQPDIIVQAVRELVSVNRADRLK